MQRYLFVRHLKFYGCYPLVKGDYDDQWLNPVSGQTAAVPLARVISDDLVATTCKQLEIPLPSVVTRQSYRVQFPGSRQRTPASGGDSPSASSSTRRAGAAAPPPGSSLELGHPAVPAHKPGRSRRALPRKPR